MVRVTNSFKHNGEYRLHSVLVRMGRVDEGEGSTVEMEAAYGRGRLNEAASSS
jgi:hypothetical protein